MRRPGQLFCSLIQLKIELRLNAHCSFGPEITCTSSPKITPTPLIQFESSTPCRVGVFFKIKRNQFTFRTQGVIRMASQRSYKKILSRGKHLAVREVFSNTRQKAGGKHRRLRGANMRSSSIVMRDEGFEGGQQRIFFNEHPESIRSENIELQECAVIAINFVRARNQGATLLLLSKVWGRRNI